MFDLNDAIRQWKKSLASNPGLEDGQRAELEACLRDEVADLVRRGFNPEEAFARVTKEMGSAEAMGLEFFKVYAKSPIGRPSWTRKGIEPSLLWNYAKIALRKFKRQKGYSIINVSGLAVGLACCALMMLWVHHEKSYDRFHVNGDSIYRVIKETSPGGKTMLDARTPFPLGPTILAKVPEIQAICRFQGYEGRDLKYGDKVITLDRNFGTADPSFFEIFSFPLLQGDPKTALAGPDAIILTESAARKIFGTEDPMGKVLTKPGHRGNYRVTGVMKDMPENSHIKVDSLVAIAYDAPNHDVGENDWESLFYYTYVQLRPAASVSAAAPKVAAVLNDYLRNLKAEILLQPLKDVHLKSHFQWDLDNDGQGSQSTLTIFSLAAIGVLFLAVINFMNLSTARSVQRAKEVGLRKVGGACRADLVGQFLGESILLSFCALGLGLAVIGFALPLFNALAGKHIAFSRMFDFPLVLGLAGMTLATGIVSGVYPAFFLSSFQPSRVLKAGAVSGSRSQAALRKVLVVLQFALTLFFVMGTAIVGRQLQYVREKDLGIDTHDVITTFVDFQDFQTVKNAFLANPNVLSVTRSSPPQKEQRGLSGVTWEGKAGAEGSEFFPVPVDPDYLETFRVGMAEGRFFSRDFPADLNESVVLNQAAARAMGFVSPVGKKVSIGNRSYTVIGVIKDFHQTSLHRPIEPMILRQSEFYWEACIRISPRNVSETIAFLQATAKRFSRNPDVSFPFEFLDDRLDGFYAAERKVEAVLGLFTAIALFTACLGLFGLASFLAERRTKELGIRKVLGASTSGLIALQTREFTKWVLVSALAAVPASFFATSLWLHRFAYHAHPGPGLFLLSILATLFVALAAVGFQSTQAARLNPVESLRYE